MGIQALQRLLQSELSRLNGIASKSSFSWGSVFQMELQKMSASPVTQPQANALQPNQLPHALTEASHTMASTHEHLAQFWSQSKAHAYDTTGHAESSGDAIAENLAIASQDAQKVAPNEYAIYGHIQPGTTELSSTNGQSYYITNVSGILYKSAVPIAMAPTYPK